MNPLVSVIVVNYNRAELLRESLQSLLQQVYRPLEILVVDNHSSDHSRAVARSFGRDSIRLLEMERNLGFAAANNVAIRRARGNWVALLNNDAVADSGWIERLMAVAGKAPRQVGMWASKVLFFQSNVIDKVGHVMYLDGQNRGRGTGERDEGQYQRLEETFFPDGCAALYRKQLLDEAGGFDEHFFAYGDDADLGLRGRWLGWKCIYVPDAVVYHRHSATSGRFSAQKVYWVERNRFWLAVKNFPLPLLVVSPLFTLNRWSWNLAAALLGRGSAGHFRRQASLGQLLLSVYRAYRDGLAGLLEMWQKRRKLRGDRRIGDLDFYRLLLEFRVSARVLAFQETDF